MRKIQIIEQQIQKQKSIRIRGVLKKREEPLEDFIRKFFGEWNQEKDTIYVDTKQVHTNAGKRRSIGDIYLIAKYYYPNVTLEQVVKVLHNLIGKFENFRTSYCRTINKRVFYKGDKTQPSAAYDGEVKDEYDMDNTQWKRQIK